MVFDGETSEKAGRLFIEGNKGLSELAAKSNQLKELNNYDDIRKSIETVAERTFPNSSVRIHFFGSRESHLYLVYLSYFEKRNKLKEIS